MKYLKTSEGLLILEKDSIYISTEINMKKQIKLFLSSFWIIFAVIGIISHFEEKSSVLFFAYIVLLFSWLFVIYRLYKKPLKNVIRYSEITKATIKRTRNNRKTILKFNCVNSVNYKFNLIDFSDEILNMLKQKGINIIVAEIDT